jgi:undecaprenyl diphosphate synthase
MHVAIIMDGNGRWATRRGLPRVAGHRAGVGTVRRMVEHAPNLGIRRMTLYAFSSDNWRRPAQEVQSIFRLMRAYLRIETEKLRQRGVQLQIIGRRDRLPKLLLREIERAEFLIAEGECLHLQIAVDYSSREAIIRAIGAFSQRLSQEPESSVDSRQNLLSAALSSENGDVDLLIRTGGEKRLSDFLLWESAYAELFFTERMWPDFDTSELDAAVADFRRRERRFGGVPTTVPHSIEPNVGPARQ